MIQGPGYIFVEIPLCGSTFVGSILREQCEGTPITPRFNPVAEKPDGTVVFTVIRKPFNRMQSMFHTLAGDTTQTNLVDWYKWLEGREELWYLTQPYLFWAKSCEKVLKLEDLERTFPPLMKSIGFDIELPDFPKKTKYPPLTEEETVFVKQARAQDFKNFGYSMDKRLKR